ncbi:MAG: DUF512 domain-containing protein [Candidatus Cloacimonetes bacterium]|nr:DUF512 domain-containing protein [Candidatus Cloacimonadota bacterium]
MPLEISAVEQGSIAWRSGLKKGDIILAINGNPINDFLDLQFYTADGNFNLVYLSGNITAELSVEQDWLTPLGIEAKQTPCKTCANHCIFCFVDQMKPGFRNSLYIKDDDYRFSFLFGNFITLTNLTEKDYQKIEALKLSPLFISVHTTNPELHRKLLGYKHDFNIVNALKRLSHMRIKLHTQIVVVPGWNDDAELSDSLIYLSGSELDNILSIGIVPVGLTDFRSCLSKLDPVDKIHAENIIKIASAFPKTYCSDEIFLKADHEIPPEEYYHDYPQLENGIGMIRLLLNNFRINKLDFLKFLRKIPEKIIFVTADLAASTIRQLTEIINRSLPDKCDLVNVQNNFFGRSVTVSGLLTARDIFSQLQLTENTIPAFSSNLFNDQNLTLDNVSSSDFVAKYGRILIIHEQFESWELLS